MNELEEKLGGKSEMKFPIGRDSGFLDLLFFLKWKSRASLNRIPWHFDLSPAFIFAAAEHRIRFFGRLHAFKNLQLKAEIVQF